MARRRRSRLFHVRKPRVRLTRRGLRVTRPSMRIGGRAGVNVSSRGVSASVRTGKGYARVGKRGLRGRVGSRAGMNFDQSGLKAPDVRRPRRRWWQFWRW